MSRALVGALVGVLAACSDDERGTELLDDAGADAAVADASAVDASLDAPPDAGATYVDISAGQDPRSGYDPSAVIDVASGKLLVVTTRGTSARPSLFRCNLDGTACTHRDISGALNGAGYYPSAVIDAANGKLLVVTAGDPTLFRCNLDGTACTHAKLEVGQGTSYFYAPSAVIDVANAKLLVVTNGPFNAYKPSLLRCDLDGTSCTHTDLSAGQGPASGYTPSAVIDAANAKLLVVTRNDATNAFTPSLFRCNLDGTACTHTNLYGGFETGIGYDPSAVIDAANGKLLVVTQDKTINISYKPRLFRCNLDGTGCTDLDISAGQGAFCGDSPSVVIDVANRKLLVATANGANASKPSVFRCDLDGTGCVHHDISAGQGTGSGAWPSAVIDAANGTLLVVTTNAANSLRPGLFTLGL